MAGVRLDGVTKRFGTTAALDGVSLDVADGAFLALLGPSGCGKTTLLRLVAGFEAPDEGRIAIGGRTVAAAGEGLVPPEDRGLGMVFQSYALWPHMNVAANVGYALKVRGLPRAERTRRIAASLAEVGLEARAAARPAELSGGQRQRVALARVFAAAPGLVLLDEPLASLDPHLREEMQTAFRRMHRRLGATMLYVTHDQEEAMALADRILVMNRGVVEDDGPPRRLYLKPRTRFVATFMGESTLLEGIVAGADPGRVVVDTAVGRLAVPGAPLAAGTAVALAIRPEQLVLGEAPPGAVPLGAVRLGETMFQGSFVRGHATSLAAPGLDLLVKLPVSRAPAPGETVRAWAMPDDFALLTI